MNPAIAGSVAPAIAKHICIGYIARATHRAESGKPMHADECYRKIAEEIDSGQQDPALWTWALAGSGGDTDKTKALYIRRRFAALTAGTQPPVQNSELDRLRGELRRQLALQRKQSLYSVLGVPADSSDAAIAEAIGRLTASGAALDAETRYAIDALGHAATREEFDRRLMEQLSSRKAAIAMPLAAARPEAAPAATNALKIAAAVTLVLGLGYLGLGYSKDKTERELRLKEAQLREAQVQRAAEIADRIVDNQQTVIEASAAAQERNAEARERALMESRMREDKYRLDNAYRQEQQAAQAEQRRQQMEQSRLQAETRRKDAEAAAAMRTVRQQAIQDAIARGNHNEAQRLRAQQY